MTPSSRSDQAKQIQAVIHHHPCFTKLTESEVDALATLFVEKKITAGNTIVKENDLVDSIYFILSGTAEVRHDAFPIATLNAGEAIGLSDTGFYSDTGMRTATVTAISDIIVMRLDLSAFQVFLQQHPHINESMQSNATLMQSMNLIKQAAPFAKLTMENTRWLAEQIVEMNVPAGKILFQKGDQGDHCYFIQSGRVEIFLTQADGSESRIASLKSPMVFGEAAIIMNLPRNASARILKDAKLLSLSRDALLKVVQTETDVASSMMTLLRSRSRPIRYSYVEHHIQEREGQESIITLKNNRDHNYYRLGLEGFFIWQLLDGQHTLRDISLAFNRQYGVFDPGMISTFIIELEEEGFIESKPGVADKEAIPKSPLAKAASQIRRVMEASYSFGNVDAWVTKLYNNGIHYVYTKPAQLVMGSLVLMGFVVFVMSFENRVMLLKNIHHTGWIMVAAVSATLFTTILHELSHAFTTKHFGRHVKNFGVGWFWLGPMAFCDTSDMWLNKNSDRVMVDLAGLYLDLFVAGVASVAALFFINPFIVLFLWLFALSHYLGVFANLSPNIELDGYYTLMDLTGVDNLRESAILWLINDFPAARKNPRLLKKHKAQVLYWAACIVYLLMGMAVPYIILNILLAGLLGVEKPLLTLCLTILVVTISSFSIWGEIKRKKA